MRKVFGSVIELRELGIADVVDFRRVRLMGLQESPASFGSTIEEEETLGIQEFERRLENSQNRRVFGAFHEQELVGVVGFRRDAGRKCRHNGFLWGVYVVPEHRGSGVGKALLEFALSTIEALPEIRNVRLGVAGANLTAVKLYEKLGFVRYGVDEEAFLEDGVYSSEFLMNRRSRRVDG